MSGVRWVSNWIPEALSTPECTAVVELYCLLTCWIQIEVTMISHSCWLFISGGIYCLLALCAGIPVSICFPSLVARCPYLKLRMPSVSIVIIANRKVWLIGYDCAHVCIHSCKRKWWTVERDSSTVYFSLLHITGLKTDHWGAPQVRRESRQLCFSLFSSCCARGERRGTRPSAYMSIAKKSPHPSKEQHMELNRPESTSQRPTPSQALPLLEFTLRKVASPCCLRVGVLSSNKVPNRARDVCEMCPFL